MFPICPRTYVPDLPSHLCSTLTWTVIVRSHYLGIFPGYAWISPGYEVPLQLHRLLVNADQLRTTPWIWKNLKCRFAHWPDLVVYFIDRTNNTQSMCSNIFIQRRRTKGVNSTYWRDGQQRSFRSRGQNFTLQLLRESTNITPSSRVSFISIFSFEYSSPFNSAKCRHTICNLLTWMWLL